MCNRYISSLSLIAVVTAASLGAVAVAIESPTRSFPTSHHLEGYTFDQFETDANRRYRSPNERHRRAAIFAARLAEIQKHNQDPTHTYRMGVNQFTDWTDDEFRRYNTYRPQTDPLQGCDPAVSSSSSTSSAIPSNFEMHMFEATGEPVPRTVDYRLATNPPVLTAIKDQGSCGNCWAHGLVESLESAFALQFGQLPVLSVQQVTSCDMEKSDGCGGGLYLFGWYYVQQSEGLYEEWTYPYTNFFARNESRAATATCVNVSDEFLPIFSWAPKTNVSSIWAVEKNNATATMEALAFHGPLTVTVAAGGWGPYESGIFVNPPNSNVGWELSHVVQLVGYGHDTDYNMNYWIVRNSWGSVWGEAGFIRLYRPAVEPCGVDPQMGNITVCGTSSVLNQPGFPRASLLKKQNM